jgi:membrane dipeptidase
LRKATGHSFTTGTTDTHIDLPRLLESGVRNQVMAVCIEAYKGREKAMWERGIANFQKLRITEKPELHFAMEGCLAVWEGWELPFHPLVASLTWNGDNPYAGGIGSSMDLSDHGRKLAREFVNRGTAVDVSHLNDRSRNSLIKTGLPLCATHCNARKLCVSNGRNLPDDDLKAIAETGGVVGVTFVPDFLEKEGSKATIESIINHVEYIAEITTIDSVGFGSDFDGTEHLPPGITGAESWHRVIDALENRGWSPENIQKVTGGNWRSFFKLEN